MEVLHTLLKSLNKNEIQVIRASLTCYSLYTEPETKTLKLFEFLLKNTEAPTSPACSLEIFNNENDYRLKDLKRRLKAKILEALTLNVNIERKGAFNELDQASIKVKKKFTQFHLLYRTKGNHPYALQLLDEIIALALKFELYESVVEGLKFKKYYQGFCKGLKDFNRINKAIAFYEYCHNSSQKANDFYYSLILRTDFHGKKDRKKLEEQLKDCIIELNKDYKYTKSAYTGYYLKLLELAYFMSNDNYVTAKETCLELLSIVNNNKSVFRKQRVGIAYDNIGHCYVYLGNYEKAAFNNHNAQKYFKHNSISYFVSKEQEFYALFYGNKLQEAEKAADKLLQISTTQGEFRVAKYHFLKANVLFKKGDYKAAWKILNRSQEISKDKEGWDVAVRILTIMTLVELERKDEAALHLESLRKHMDKYNRKRKKKEDKERDGVILKMLQQLERQSFDFDKKNSKIIKELDLLSGNDKKYRWECLTPELIPFHQWYAAKAGYLLPELAPAPAPKKRKKEKLVLVLK